MKINHKTIAASSLFVATLLLLSSLTACPLSVSASDVRRADEPRGHCGDCAVSGSAVSGSSSRPESTLRIREVLRGKTLSRTNASLAVGQVVVVDKEAAGNTGDLFLIAIRN